MSVSLLDVNVLLALAWPTQMSTTRFHSLSWVSSGSECSQQ